MGYHINLLKNKFKRLKIEVHHNKNKISSKEHVIKNRDPSRPLITLRTFDPATNIDPVEVEETIEEQDDEQEESPTEQNDFIGFSDRSEGDGVETHSQNDDNHNNTVIGSTIRSYISAYKKIKSGQSSVTLEVKRQQCKCTCHNDTEGSLRSPLYHNQHCLSFCDKTNYTPPSVNEVSKKVVNHVNYIEPKSRLRRRFWFFKRRHPLSKIPDPPTPIEEEDPPSNSESIISAVDRIEIIAQSTGGIDQSSIFDQQDAQEVETEKIAKSTSYARRNTKAGVPLIDLSRSNSGYAKETYSPASKQHKSNEPWRMIMNDISLHAALLSTGSKPVLSKSSLNLVADFTSSKHDPNQRSFSNNSCHSELISFRSIPPLQHQQQQIPSYQYLHQQVNNENLIQDTFFNDNDDSIMSNGLDKTIVDETRKPSSSVRHYLESRPSTHKSKISMNSDTLENDPLKGAETSAVYGGVFQDYNYSDESVEGWKDVELTSRTNLIKKENSEPTNLSNEILPLNIANKGLSRIF